MMYDMETHIPGKISSVLCYYQYLAENVTKAVNYNQYVNIHKCNVFYWIP